MRRTTDLVTDSHTEAGYDVRSRCPAGCDHRVSAAQAWFRCSATARWFIRVRGPLVLISGYPRSRAPCRPGPTAGGRRQHAAGREPGRVAQQRAQRAGTRVALALSGHRAPARPTRRCSGLLDVSVMRSPDPCAFAQVLHARHNAVRLRDQFGKGRRSVHVMPCGNLAAHPSPAPMHACKSFHLACQRASLRVCGAQSTALRSSPDHRPSASAPSSANTPGKRATTSRPGPGAARPWRGTPE